MSTGCIDEDELLHSPKETVLENAQDNRHIFLVHTIVRLYAPWANVHLQVCSGICGPKSTFEL